MLPLALRPGVTSKVSSSSPMCSGERHIQVDVTALNAEQLQRSADRLYTFASGWVECTCSQYLEFATNLGFSADSTWVCRPADVSPLNWSEAIRSLLSSCTWL
jgi:hypothetical protein